MCLHILKHVLVCPHSGPGLHLNVFTDDGYNTIEKSYRKFKSSEKKCARIDTSALFIKVCCSAQKMGVIIEGT